jgi:23S rRNA pseudouridine2605 synthase
MRARSSSRQRVSIRIASPVTLPLAKKIGGNEISVRVEKPDLRRKSVGLARALSKMGHCSRSQAIILIRAGRVALNGRIVRDPEIPTRLSRDRIDIDGSAVEKTPPIYMVMNKPRGVVTTASDEKGRDTVYGLLDSELPWVAPVGRLDKASEGLLLLTNDSEWAAKVTEPSSHLDKSYHVQIDRVPDAELLTRVTHDCVAVDRPAVRPSQELSQQSQQPGAKAARVLRQGEKNGWLEIILDEGKNRQIRRLLNALNVRVLRLVRVSIGPLELGDLKKGATRRLTPEEKNAIDRALRTP